MKFLLTNIAIIAVLTNISFSQTKDTNIYDLKAKKILDQLSQKMSNKNFQINFEYTIYNAQDSSKQSLKGYLYAKGEKYKIIIPFAEFFSDGTNTYAYNKKANEMTIQPTDPNNEQVYTPNKMLNMYKNGFKYTLKGEATGDFKQKINGKLTKKNLTCYVIDLYPEKPKTSEISIIRIWIEKNKIDLISIKFQYTSGIEEVIEVLEQKIDITISDDLFKFDKNKYPKNLDITKIE